MMEARVQGGKVWGETRIAKMLIIAMPFAIVGTKFSEAQLSAEELKPWQYCDFAKESEYFSLPRQQVIAPDSMFSVFAPVALVALGRIVSANHDFMSNFAAGFESETEDEGRSQITPQPDL